MRSETVRWPFHSLNLLLTLPQSTVLDERSTYHFRLLQRVSLLSEMGHEKQRYFTVKMYPNSYQSSSYEPDRFASIKSPDRVIDKLFSVGLSCLSFRNERKEI
jgi:hypothetical protein